MCNLYIYIIIRTSFLCGCGECEGEADFRGGIGGGASISPTLGAGGMSKTGGGGVALEGDVLEAGGVPRGGGVVFEGEGVFFEGDFLEGGVALEGEGDFLDGGLGDGSLEREGVVFVGGAASLIWITTTDTRTETTR